MPLTISQINKRTKAATLLFEVDGRREEVHLVYRPGWYTAAREAEWQDIEQDAAHRAKQLTTALAEILVSWDVTDDKGKPYPTDAKALAAIDADGFLAAVFTCVMEDLHPNLKTGATSAGG